MNKTEYGNNKINNMLPVDAVNASGAVSAGVGVALVHVDFTVTSRRARLTTTLVAAD